MGGLLGGAKGMLAPPLKLLGGGLATLPLPSSYAYVGINNSAVGRASDSRTRGPGFSTQSGHLFSFLLPLIQEGQLSVTGESMCTKNWLTA